MKKLFVFMKYVFLFIYISVNFVIKDFFSLPKKKIIDIKVIINRNIRKKMFCRFLVFSIVLLSLFVFRTLCVPKCSGQPTAKAEVVDLFAPGEKKKITDVFQPNGKDKIEGEENIVFKNITAPFLLAVDDVMVTVAERNYTDKESAGNNEKVDLVAKYIKIEKNKVDWGKTFIEKLTTPTELKTQLATQNEEVAKGFSVVRAAVVSAKNKIYFFAVNNTQTGTGGLSATPPREFTVVEGTISSDIICWKKLSDPGKSLKTIFNEKFKDVTLGMSPSDGSAFLFGKDKKVVFVVQGQTKDSNKKNVTAFIQLEETGSEQLKLLNVETAEKCYPYFFPWGDKIMMIPTDCDNDRNQKVKESTNMVTWNDSSESLSRLWDAFQDKKGFTTTKINESTILFTYNSTENTQLSTHLWISDGTRMADVGTIVTKDEGSFYGSILYDNGELFILYKKNTNDQTLDTQKTIVLKRLKNVMSEITRVLNAWKNSDDAVTKLCTENTDSKKYDCATNFSKNGLVGFLFDKGNANEWKDVYYFSNATVTVGTEFENGFKFAGQNKVATWSVGKAEDQPYNFAEPGFTLVATVIIDKITTDKDNSIFGVKLTATEKSIGLLCTKDATWRVKVKNTQSVNSENMEPNRKCVQGEKYQVALVYSGKNELSVYVDWEILGSGKPFEMNKENQKELEFYFGNDGTQANVESHVTVRNALLYNRPLTVSEIKELKKNVKAVKVTTNPNENAITDTTGGDQHPPPLPQDPIGKEQKDEKSPSPSRTEDGGVDGGVRVFSLLLAVLCVSAPLLHL